MKSALSLTLIVCLVASAVPLTAQRTETLVSFGIPEPASLVTVRPLTLAVARKTARFAAVQQSNATQPDWSPGRTLAPGREITVTVNGSQPRVRYFLLADESDLTVLNLTGPTLTGDATKALRAVASYHPDYFVAAEKDKVSSAFKSNYGNVRVGPDGAFVAGHKVADLGQIIERFARTEVLSVVETEHGPSLGASIAIVSGVVAGVIVLVLLGRYCSHAC